MPQGPCGPRSNGLQLPSRHCRSAAPNGETREDLVRETWSEGGPQVPYQPEVGGISSSGLGPSDSARGDPSGCGWRRRTLREPVGCDLGPTSSGKPLVAGPPHRQRGIVVLLVRALARFAGSLSPGSGGRLLARRVAVLVRQGVPAVPGARSRSQQGPSDAYSEGPLLLGFWPCQRVVLRHRLLGELGTPRQRHAVRRGALAHSVVGLRRATLKLPAAIAVTPVSPSGTSVTSTYGIDDG